jgi:hypothetical protein
MATSGGESAPIDHKLAESNCELPTLIALFRKFQVQEQIPGDDECKQ